MLCDLHTHILPGIDDGAADLSESITLLTQEKDCGVDTVVLTPHFKPQLQKPTDFLENRARAFEQLTKASDGSIRFLLGAEVLYSKYLSAIENLRDFCIQDTDYLLLEMPYHAKFDDRVLQSVGRLVDEHGILPILAHVERYEAVRRDPEILLRFREMGALFQVNAQSFLQKNFGMRRFLRRLIRMDCLDLVATDCHDPKTRPARLSHALEAIEKEYFPSLLQRVLAATQTVIDNQRW